MNNENLAGIHFTGSTAVFQNMWKTVGDNIHKYKSYPRIVGETGGKDFVMVHESAEIKETATGIVRGSFEYQGQKCSAVSRTYIPSSIWPELRKEIEDQVNSIKMGTPLNFTNFMNAVIDEASFDGIMEYINHAQNSDDAEVIIGGNGDKSEGYFIEPTVILAKDPKYLTMREEIFGPVLTIYVYDAAKLDETLDLLDETSEYALTGGVFRDCYNILGGIEEVIPVDAYIPGCPPRPEAIIDGVVKLLSSLQAPAACEESQVLIDETGPEVK